MEAVCKESERLLPEFAGSVRHARRAEVSQLYFRGLNKQLDLKLTMHCQIAEGVDDNTWVFHLNRGIPRGGSPRPFR